MLYSLRDVNNADPAERLRHFPFARVTYLVFFFVYLVALFLATDDYVPFALIPISDALSSVPFFTHRYNCSLGVNDTVVYSCYSDQLISRISFAYFCYHFLLALLTIRTESDTTRCWSFEWKKRVHDGFWWLKVPVLVVFVAITVLLFPWQFSYGYYYIAAAAAIAYLFFQAILLVDFAYSCHEWLGQENSLNWRMARYTVTILVNVVSLILFFLTMYWWGIPVRTCYQNFIVISSVVVVCGFASILSFHPSIERGSVITSSLISLYCILIVMSGIVNNETRNCHPVSDFVVKAFHIATASAAVLLSVIYSSLYYFVSHRFVAHRILEESEIDAEDKGFFDHISPQLTPRERSKSSDTYIESQSLSEAYEPPEYIDPDSLPYSYAKFHLVFALAILYIGVAHINAEHATWNDVGSVTTGVLGHWIKYVIFIVTMALYVWSLVAPIVLRSARQSTYESIRDSEADYSGSGREKNIRRS